MKRCFKIKKQQLSQLDVMRLRAFEAERNLAAQTVTISKLEKAELLHQIDPGGRVKQAELTIMTSLQAHTVAEDRYREVVDEIEKRMHISLKDFHFDDETGELLPASPGGKHGHP